MNSLKTWGVTWVCGMLVEVWSQNTNINWSGFLINHYQYQYHIYIWHTVCSNPRLCTMKDKLVPFWKQMTGYVAATETRVCVIIIFLTTFYKSTAVFILICPWCIRRLPNVIGWRYQPQPLNLITFFFICKEKYPLHLLLLLHICTRCQTHRGNLNYGGMFWSLEHLILLLWTWDEHCLALVTS